MMLHLLIVFHSSTGLGYELHQLTKTLAEKVGRFVEQYVEAMEKVKLKQGLKTAMSISSEEMHICNQFWKLYKEDQPSCSIVVKTSVGLVHLLACLLEPLCLPSLLRAKRPWEIVPAGHRIGTPEPLFKELEKFAGSQADRIVKAEAEAKKIAEQLKNKNE
ncbi:hypothetical protein AAG906_016618 [Vitis piasezkii]